MRWLRLLLYLPMVISHPLRCASIYGLETPLRNFVCSWKHDVSFYVAVLAQLGFNCIRLPFSYQYVQEADFSKMDHFMEVSQQYNMSVIADLHRVVSDHQGPDPFEGGVTMDQFINCWKTVLRRYERFPCLEHMNAYNEPQGNDPQFINDYSRKLFTAVENEFPNRFRYWLTGTNWAGSLVGIDIEDVPFKDRVGYSVHKYAWSGTADERDWEYSIPRSVPLEKLIIGEWGWMEDKPNEVEWSSRFIQYLKRRGIQHTCFWTISNSHDTGNLFFDDCDTFKWQTYFTMKQVWEASPPKLRRQY